MIPPSTSLLAPLLVGTSRDPGDMPTMGNALLGTANSVPRTYEPARFKKGGLMNSWEQDGDRTYRVFATLDEEGPDHNVLVAFYREPGPHAAAAGVSPVEFWCVGLRDWNSDPIGSFEGARTVGILETIRVRIGNDGFEGAVELALLRHTWLATLRAADPALVVQGGDDVWNDSWTRPLHHIDKDN